jgi:hypothetical protein
MAMIAITTNSIKVKARSRAFRSDLVVILWDSQIKLLIIIDK